MRFVMKKKDILIYLGLIIISLLAATLIVDTNAIFGSKTDWINQHTIFPEYFRNLFYQTGKLLPNFAPHIGAGQNIFNFSYYGLLNPIILISYFFPKIEMTTYIIIANTGLFIISTILLYYFLNKHTKQAYTAFLSTIIMILSSSFLFHFHRHFMFVDYMPFLILGLLGIDQYFEKGKRILLTVSTFLMIMISYFYSIIGIVIFILYGVYCYIQKTKKITIQQFLIDGVKFLIPIIIAIISSAVLLLPTAHVILEGRGSQENSISFLQMLLPRANIGAILYDTYSLGLTTISIIALIHVALKKERHNRFLSWSILLIISFPIFIYILNGGLYIRNKVFIPFLPLIGLMLVKFLDDFFHKSVDLKKLFILTIGIAILGIFFPGKISIYFFYLELIITFLVLFIYQKTGKKLLFILPTLFIVLTNWFIGQKTDHFIEKEFYDKSFDNRVVEKFQHYLQEEKEMTRSANLDSTLYTVNKVTDSKYYTTSIYSSTYHKDYNNFQKSIFENPLPNRNKLILTQSNNIMFQTFMGIKYVSYSKTPSIGYQSLSDKGRFTIYKNENVMPIGYMQTNIMNIKDFMRLPYPQKQEALIKSVIVDKDHTNFDFSSQSRKITSSYSIPQNNKNLKIQKDKGKYIIDAKVDTTIRIPLEKTLHDEILFITFKVHNKTDCAKPTQKIGINSVYNKKSCKSSEYDNHNDTFHYVLSQNKDWNTLSITIGEGHYVISDINTYILDYDTLTNKIGELDRWEVRMSESDVLEGKIKVKKDGYFTSSIPYDDGFTIYVDGKKITYEKVNTAFIGFKLKKGEHIVKMVYHSPLLNTGIIVSLLGIFSFIIMVILEKKKLIK